MRFLYILAEIVVLYIVLLGGSALLIWAGAVSTISGS